MQTTNIPLEKLIAYAGNPRKNDHAVEAVASAIKRFGFRVPVLAKSDGSLIDGHLRVKAAKHLGMKEVPVVLCDDLSEADIKALRISINRMAELAEWDSELLSAELEGLAAEGITLEDVGFDTAALEELGADLGLNQSEQPETKKLSDRFGVAPFSVLNAREGWWQDRKRSWLSLGIQSELGRSDDALKFSEACKKGYASDSAELAGTSIFDPVLCELAYSWFCPKDGMVLDPFAGGSVRGIVASQLGRKYVGVELRAEQVAANKAQQEICSGPIPVWNCGDSREIATICKEVQSDFVFSCPPYADLERYSDNPSDISTLSYEAFLAAYRQIIEAACSLLKQDRFACFVVGDVRDKRGAYRNFVGDTVEAFRSAGLDYYNEAILVTAAGSLPIRAGKQFSASRKLGKTHQNVLVFVKGDGKKAAQACGEVTPFVPEQESGLL
jgi:DNA modification methylase